MAEQRHILRHYFNIGTKDEPKYALLGDGITSLTEEFNPNTESNQYIHQKNASSATKSYAPSIDVTKEYIKDEDLQKWMDEKVDVLPVGSEAESDYIRINLLRPGTADGTYIAVKRECSYAMSSVGGEAGSNLATGMTISGIGDGIKGVFDVKTLTFTPDDSANTETQNANETEATSENG